MNYFTHHWTFDPMIIAVAITVVAHEIGLSRLAARSSAARTRRRRLKSLAFYGGLAMLVLTVVSPLDYWASSYFFVHMLEHIFLALFVPALIVIGAPWIPLLFALPVGPRRRVGKFFYLNSKVGWLRAIGRFFRNPWFALISFNGVMLLWHNPTMFELSERNQLVHVWLMHGSFIVTGTLFWLQIIPSYPLKPMKGPVWQAGSVLSSNIVMTMLAISMSILTKVSWYPSYSNIPGVTLSPFADQQIGAAILWVCGDFWAGPALALVIRRAVRSEDSVGDLIDRLTGRGASPTIEEFRASDRLADVDGGDESAL